MKLSGMAKKMVRAICLISLPIAVAGAAYYRSLEALPFAFGVFLGAALNIAKVVMLERAVDKTVGMEKAGASNYARLQYLLRFVLTGLVLALAVFVPFINLWGAAAGIVLTWQIAAYTLKRSYTDGEGGDKDDEKV